MSVINCRLIIANDVSEKMVRTRAHPQGGGDSHAAREFGAGQVLASLLVSVLLVGIKLTSAKEIVQLIERRKELKANLELLQPKLEDENRIMWLNDTAHDMARRQERMSDMSSPSGRVYSTIESHAIDSCLGMLALLAGKAGNKQLKRVATFTRR